VSRPRAGRFGGALHEAQGYRLPARRPGRSRSSTSDARPADAMMQAFQAPRSRPTGLSGMVTLWGNGFMDVPPLSIGRRLRQGAEERTGGQ
jgi:hypothetical protein